MRERINPFLTRRRHKLGKGIASDPQRHLVYAMERRIAGWAIYAHVEEEDLQRIADYCCRKFKVKRVGVVVENMGGTSDARVFGYCRDNSIHLNADFHGDNTAVLVHELAHFITDQKFPDVETHGPTFMEVYAQLLDMLNLFPYDQFLSLCAEYGVAVGAYDHES